MEQIESYSFHTVTDFNQRRSAMQMFLELGEVMRRILTRQWLGEDMVGAPRAELRRALMKRLTAKDGDQLWDRIRLAHRSESRHHDEDD